MNKENKNQCDADTDRIQLSGCIILRKGKILLLSKKKHGHYELPGGKVEQNETIEQTAIREAKEEIGCDVILTKYLFYIDFTINEKNYRSHNFLVEIKQGQEPFVNEKEIFDGLIWLSAEEIGRYKIAPNVLQIIEQHPDVFKYKFNN